MKATIFLLYYLSIMMAVSVGAMRYKHLGWPMRVIVMLLSVTAISEFCCYIAYEGREFVVRNAIYHVYSIIQAILYSLYFIYALKPYHYRKVVLAAIIVWGAIGIANATFLQPLAELNTNVLLLESFAFVTMSLYYIYRRVRGVDNRNILQQPNFIFAIIFLINWSSTLFFWATIKILYRNHWKYIQTMMDMQVVIGTLVYASIAATLLLHPKKNTIENI